jgi:hypothetical protein
MMARTSSTGVGFSARSGGAPQRVDLLEHAPLGAALVGAALRATRRAR